MGYVPKDAPWFLAELILECRIEGDPRNIVHVNTHLVRADTADQAYSKALELGANGESEYINPDGKQVNWRFRGLRDLFMIHDPLEDGSELIYEEQIDLPEDLIQADIRPRGRLAVFRDSEPVGGPNYMPKDIMDRMFDALGQCALDASSENRDDQN